MFTCRRFLAGLLLGTLPLGILPSSEALAETSAHKLKKKLHKVEHKAGAAARQVGEILRDGFSGVTLDLDFDLCGDDDSATVAVLKGGKATANNPHPSQKTRAPGTAHPDK